MEVVKTTTPPQLRLESGETVRLLASSGKYLTITQHQPGLLQVENYLAPLLNWNQHFVELEVSATVQGRPA